MYVYTYASLGLLFSRALFQNKTVYISLRITIMLRMAILRGLRGGSNLLVVVVLIYCCFIKVTNVVRGESTQVESSYS